MAMDEQPMDREILQPRKHLVRHHLDSDEELEASDRCIRASSCSHLSGDEWVTFTIPVAIN